jgi:1,4-dihydroxy-2-naphthoate octaprenyltransferase
VVPVLIGSGVALGYGRFSWWRALLALVVALALQVGVNFANDYSDGIRGSDERRVGPVRLVAAGLAPPRQVGGGRTTRFPPRSVAPATPVRDNRRRRVSQVGERLGVALRTGGADDCGRRAAIQTQDEMQIHLHVRKRLRQIMSYCGCL